MDREMVLFSYGFTAGEAQAIAKAALIFAERVKIAIEEAERMLSQAFSAVVTQEVEEIKEFLDELEEIGKETRARRRKQARSRARVIEQRYRAEIHRVERETIYRRIYKPP